MYCGLCSDREENQLQTAKIHWYIKFNSHLFLSVKQGHIVYCCIKEDLIPKNPQLCWHIKRFHGTRHIWKVLAVLHEIVYIYNIKKWIEYIPYTRLLLAHESLRWFHQLDTNKAVICGSPTITNDKLLPQRGKASLDYSVLSFQKIWVAQDTEKSKERPTDWLTHCVCALVSSSLMETSWLGDFSHACLLLCLGCSKLYLYIQFFDW